MEARAQAEPSNEPRSFEFVLPKVDEATFGETHSQDTHNSGNTEGGGNDPATPANIRLIPAHTIITNTCCQ